MKRGLFQSKNSSFLVNLKQYLKYSFAIGYYKYHIVITQGVCIQLFSIKDS